MVDDIIDDAASFVAAAEVREVGMGGGRDTVGLRNRTIEVK